MLPLDGSVDVIATLDMAAELCMNGRNRTAFDRLELAIAKSDDPRLALAAAKIALAWDAEQAQLLAELAISRGCADPDVYRVLADALDAKGEWSRAQMLRSELDLPPSLDYRRGRTRQLLGLVGGTAFGAAVISAAAAILLWQPLALELWGENATHVAADRAADVAATGYMDLDIVPTTLAAAGRTVCAEVHGQVICDTANHYLYSTGRVEVPGEATGWGTQGGAACVATTDGFPRCVSDAGVVEQHAWWVEMSETCGLLASGALDCMDGTHLEGPFVQVAASDYGTCGLDDGGAIACVGQAPYAPGPMGSYVKLLGHKEGFCALRVDGASVCWGAKVADDAPHGVDIALAQVVGRNGLNMVTLAVLAPDRRTIHVKDPGYAWRTLEDAPEKVTSLAVGSAVCAEFVSGAVACEHEGWHAFPFPKAPETASAR